MPRPESPAPPPVLVLVPTAPPVRAVLFEIVQGLFSLKHLLLFTKCTNLSNSIEIFIKNDYPMIIRYGVANLGEIKRCLSPKLYSD